MYYPTLDEIEKIKENKEYRYVPVSMEILSDFITPIEAIRVLKKVSTNTYMLESAKANENWGRYTFLGFEPDSSISCIDGKMNVDGEEFNCTYPSSYLRELLKKYKSPRFSSLPPFTGGLVGYFSFDYINYKEPGIKNNINDTEGFKDIDVMLFKDVIVFDHVKQKIILITNILLEGNTSIAYKKGVEKLEKIKKLLYTGEKFNDPGKLLSEFSPLFSEKEFSKMIKEAKHHIKEGDIFQIVLSNRLQADFEGSLFDSYRMLRTVNPSPYMFYFSGTDVEIAGASPETLVKLEEGILHTFPLAGTKPRGKTEKEDKIFEEELLADEKELAEHNMLVDLGRNDLGKISKFGSVKVEKLHSVERYSHVMHIGSTVRGEIRPENDALDALEAVLPAGTLSGAPKLRACKLIGELENNKRGVYGGAIGYIDFTGNMDTCIAIRLAYKKNGKVFIRSGAGIVADSKPEKEYMESINKAGAVVDALKKAQEMNK
jgi:anthranilate synthase component I